MGLIAVGRRKTVVFGSILITPPAAACAGGMMLFLRAWPWMAPLTSASHCSMPPPPPRVGSTLKQILIRIYVNIYGVRIGHLYYLPSTAVVNIISIKYMTFRDMHLLHVI